MINRPIWVLFDAPLRVSFALPTLFISQETRTIWYFYIGVGKKRANSLFTKKSFFIAFFTLYWKLVTLQEIFFLLHPPLLMLFAIAFILFWKYFLYCSSERDTVWKGSSKSTTTDGHIYLYISKMMYLFRALFTKCIDGILLSVPFESRLIPTSSSTNRVAMLGNKMTIWNTCLASSFEPLKD